MLGLKMGTDPRWVNIVEKNLEEILVDHAWCEQKAAATCMSLIVQYPEKKKIVDLLTPVVAEEWEHFRRVLAEIEKRGYKLQNTRPDLYVQELLKLVRKGGDERVQIMDKLLVLAIIEARSCERFRVLSLEIADESLKEFYHELMVSEAGHYMNFVTLAQEFQDEKTVKERLEVMMLQEAEILMNLDYRSDRVHGPVKN